MLSLFCEYFQKARSSTSAKSFFRVSSKIISVLGSYHGHATLKKTFQDILETAVIAKSGKS
jgi:hypothetical protein